jgi:hypothetical protein
LPFLLFRIPGDRQSPAIHRHNPLDSVLKTGVYIEGVMKKKNSGTHITPNFMAFTPQAKSNGRVTATGRRILVPTFVDRGLSHSQRG